MEADMRVKSMGGATGVQVAGMVLAVMLLGASARAESGAATGAEAGVWTPKELTFIYQGFTTKYSCDGLQDKMQKILLQLGARRDLEVRGFGCMQLNRPELVSRVRIKMNILQPAGNQSGQAVPAHWKMVDLLATHQPVDEEGNCELIEQIRQKVLPLFATRNVDYSSTCVPRQVNIGTTRLKAEVLVADQ
jgi:hypothetical protein